MSPKSITIFLCGDVMIGRGIDQILPHPCDPILYEGYARSALDYVTLAEYINGPISRPAPVPYIWGAALDELARFRPQLRIINLETSVTRSPRHWPKGINYRASPENAACLSALGVDCCALANNHVLDWGRAGLIETLETLDRLRIKASGAGRNQSDAWGPAVFEIEGTAARVLIFSCAIATSGPPDSWAATNQDPGIAFLPDTSRASSTLLIEHIAKHRRAGDIIILSLHWGPNWGYDIPARDRDFAHRLIDEADVSILHGHSSHHPKGLEIYNRRLIINGCGDFLNDYEGISGYEEFHGELSLMYFVQLDVDSRLLGRVTMTPLKMRRFQLVRPRPDEAQWLCDTLDRESRKLGAAVTLTPDERLELSLFA